MNAIGEILPPSTKERQPTQVGAPAFRAPALRPHRHLSASDKARQGPPWPHCPHLQTPIPVGTSDSAKFPEDLEVWCRSPRTSSHRDSLTCWGGHQCPPDSWGSSGEGVARGPQREAPQAGLSYMTGQSSHTLLVTSPPLSGRGPRPADPQIQR